MRTAVCPRTALRRLRCGIVRESGYPRGKQGQRTPPPGPPAGTRWFIGSVQPEGLERPEWLVRAEPPHATAGELRVWLGAGRPALASGAIRRLGSIYPDCILVLHLSSVPPIQQGEPVSGETPGEFRAVRMKILSHLREMPPETKHPSRFPDWGVSNYRRWNAGP